MGTQLPIGAVPEGDLCWCHPKAEYTPRIMYVVFFDIASCPLGIQPPNLHVFTCFQSDVSPCLWLSDTAGSGWEVSINYLCGLNQTHVFLLDLAVNSYFWGVRGGFANEHDVFDNNNMVCGFNILGILGGCFVFWMDTALNLIDSLNIPNDGNTFMEIFITDEDEIVIKFCNIRFGINIKMKLEP